MPGQFNVLPAFFISLIAFAFLAFVVIRGLVKYKHHKAAENSLADTEKQKVYITTRGMNVLSDRFLPDADKKEKLFLSELEIEVLQWTRGTGKTFFQFVKDFGEMASHQGLNLSPIINSLKEMDLIYIK